MAVGCAVVPGPVEEDTMATPDTGTGATQPARHVLAVYTHPWAHSFTGFILHSAVRGVRAAGHSVEIADLYAEGFDPVLRHADYASQFFYEVDDDPASNEEHLSLAYDLGKTFLATERT
jgi:hypothetical protein